MRIYCLEDNALVVMHLEMVIEDAGHELAGSAASFDEAVRAWEDTPFDLALVDIDLADGKTGIDAARWLNERGHLAAFVTGQASLAASHEDLVMAVLHKPIDETCLKDLLSAAEARLLERANR